MVKSGASFSGRERHCAFLNRRDGTFATVSAISGLDLPDDGRAAARVDWDGDGDLDLWVSNRSGPQLRYFRNDLVSGNQFLTVSLEGRSSNRDAIGARLELYIKGRKAPLVRSLRAGCGFLSQSSKWIHFGLGREPEIDRLVVRWPRGQVEQFRDLQAGGRYRVVQGEGKAEPLPRRKIETGARRPVESVAAKGAAESSSAVHVLSQALTPLPSLSYRDWEGTISPVFTGSPKQPARPILLNLWASWCAPCLVELREFAQKYDALREAGLQVVALSVDRVDGAGDSDAAERLIDKLDPPFPTGVADARLVEKLQLVHDMNFELHESLPVPCSILIDAKGRMSAIYKGRVTVERVLSDVEKFEMSAGDRRDASLPFAGRWFASARPLHLFNLAWHLFERDFFDEGIAFYVHNAARIKGHPNHAKLLLMIGDGCLKNGRPRLAARMFEEALREHPGWAEAQERLDRISAGRGGS